MKFYNKFLYLNVKKIKYLDMNKINKFLQLASLIAKFSTVNTDKGQLTATDEIAEGVEVYIKDETSGEFIAAPDGDYETEESIITVKDGKVEKIEAKNAESNEAKEATQETTTETMNEEFARKMRFAEESYNDLMQKIHNAIGEDNYVVDAGDGWAVIVVYKDDTEKTYRYTYSLDAEGNVILGERVEVYPRYVTDEEAKQLDFAEQAPADEQAPAEDPKDVQIKDLETKITELEGLLQDRDAVIEELTAKIKELEDKAQAPVEEPVKMSATIRTQCYSEKDIPALKYFK